MSLLEIKDLHVHYSSEDKEVKALNGIQLSIQKGETVGLVGETGAGKTTLALSIMKLIQSPPGKYKQGEIFFNGSNLLELNEKQMRGIRGKQISMIFQDPMTPLNPVYTVGDQIAEVIWNHEGVSRDEARRKAGSILERVGITAERGIDYPHQFSGGMRQRVGIAMGLACNPQLLIADEPTTALDVTIQAQVLDLMKQLKNELDTSMLLITHDLGIVAETCDKVAIIYAGEIVEFGTLEDIFENASHPYTIGLFRSIPSLEKKEHRLQSIKGLMPDPSELPVGCSFHARCEVAQDQCVVTKPKGTKLSKDHTCACLFHELAVERR